MIIEALLEETTKLCYGYLIVNTFRKQFNQPTVFTKTDRKLQDVQINIFQSNFDYELRSL